VTRPGDWSPLRGSDPTPGSPDVVAEQARRSGDVAAELRAQVSRLRRIGADQELRGEYADRLRESAEELVGDLQQIERRYARVATALHRWEPQLREGQESADRIRLRARALDDERRALHRQAGTVGHRELPDDPTPAQQTAFEADQAAAERVRRRLEGIDDQLRDLDRELGSVEDRVLADGRAVGSEIRAAVADDIEDTTWEDVKGAVVEAWRAVDARIDMIADGLRLAVEALQYVALALAVAALFIPGLNVLVVALTVSLALTQGMLYATGNATFTDLALAGLSLLTLGMGAVGGKLISRAFTRTRAAAASRDGARAAGTARAETRAAREALGRRSGQRLHPAERARVRNQLDQLKARTSREADARAARAEREYLDRPVPRATRLEDVSDGGWENAGFMNDITRMQREFPHADVLAAGQGAGTGLRLAQTGQWVGFTNDVGSLAAGQSQLFPGKPYSHEFEDFKKRWEPLR
jgi:hypothetical protein